MSQYFSVHPSHPQQRLLARAAEELSRGGLAAYPTDTAYALGCHIGDKQAQDRVRQLRRLDKNHHLTLMCRDLSEISLYARVDNANYRILKHYTPGPYTFLLPATKEVPRRLVHPKRKTIGLRIPDSRIVLGLLEALGEPILSTTLRLPDQEFPMRDAAEVRDALEHSIDVIIDGGSCGIDATTIVDLAVDPGRIVRQGVGEFT